MFKIMNLYGTNFNSQTKYSRKKFSKDKILYINISV